MSHQQPTPYMPSLSSLRKPSPKPQPRSITSAKQRESLHTESPNRSSNPVSSSTMGRATSGRVVSTSYPTEFYQPTDSISPTVGIRDHYGALSYGNDDYEDDEDFYDEDGIPIGPVTGTKLQPNRKRKASILDGEDAHRTSDPNDTPDPITINGFNRARALKMAFQPNHNIPDSGLKKRSVEDDPENHMIKRLRCDENLGWGVIAEILNGERVKQGGDPSWTSAGVYSRFVRNAPRIAQMQGEAFDHKDYVNKKDKKAKKGNTALPKLSESNQVMLVEAYGEAQAGFWDRVADSMCAKSGRDISADECARLFQLI